MQKHGRGCGTAKTVKDIYSDSQSKHLGGVASKIRHIKERICAMPDVIMKIQNFEQLQIALKADRIFRRGTCVRRSYEVVAPNKRNR